MKRDQDNNDVRVAFVTCSSHKPKERVAVAFAFALALKYRPYSFLNRMGLDGTPYLDGPDIPLEFKEEPTLSSDLPPRVFLGVFPCVTRVTYST
jgi:hypothetical protein